MEEAALDGLDPDPESLDDEDLQDALRGDGGSPGGGGGGGARAVKRTGKGVERRQVAGSRPSKGHEIHTWEACARVVKKERADFFEFVVSFVAKLLSQYVDDRLTLCSLSRSCATSSSLQRQWWS